MRQQDEVSRPQSSLSCASGEDVGNGLQSGTTDVTTCRLWVCAKHTLHSEIIAQLIPRNLFRAMITRISRYPARNASSGIFWRNDKMTIAQIDSWKQTKNSKKAESNTKIAQSPQKPFPKLILRDRLRLSYPEVAGPVLPVCLCEEE